MSRRLIISRTRVARKFTYTSPRWFPEGTTVHVGLNVSSRPIRDRVSTIDWSGFRRKRLLSLLVRFHPLSLLLPVSCGFCSGASPPNIYASFGFSFQILLLPDPPSLRSLSLPRRSLPRRGRRRRRRAAHAPPRCPRPLSDVTGPRCWPLPRLPLRAASSRPSAAARRNPSCRVLAGRACGSALLSSAFLSRWCR